MQHQAPFHDIVMISADPGTVWQVLTTPSQMLAWMGEPDLQLSIDADWQPGHPFIIRGIHHVPFENRGIVLDVIPERRLRYTQLNSVSRLPDVRDSYTILDFELQAQDTGTALTLTMSNFPTESIRRHLEFYWRGTLVKIRHHAEALLTGKTN